jgi:hypothetical protein
LQEGLHAAAAPSTVRESPTGDVTSVVVGNTAKLALTDVGPLRVSVCGVDVPLSAPENPVNQYPPPAVALTGTVPAFCQPLAGEMLPPLPADVVR